MSENTQQEQALAPTDRKLALAHELRQAGGDEKVTLALRFAALSGRFSPDDALRAAGFPPAGSAPSLDRLAAVSRLVEACDTRLWQPDWIMRGQARERCIAGMASHCAQMAAWRREQDPLPPTAKDICDALAGDGCFTPEAVDRVLASEFQPLETYEQLIRGITLAQPLAPARDRLDGLRAALAQAKAALAQGSVSGFLGREEEIARIARSVARQWAHEGSATALGALYIAAEGGVGKSALLAQASRAHAVQGAICVSLDFDRPGIDGNDPLGLSREAARQVAEAVGAPAAGLSAAIASASGATGTKSPLTLADRLCREVAAVLATTDRPLLVLADALEALARFGDSAALGFLEWLRLLKATIPRLALVGAGRGPLPPLFSGEVEVLHLTGLPDEAARRIVAATDGDDTEAVLTVAAGNPLILHIGARLASRGQSAALTGAELAEAAPADKAYGLYQALLAGMADPRARDLARAGMLLRRVNAELLAEVIAPEVGIDTLTVERAGELIDEFRQHAWLVEERDGYLVPCADQRRAMLERQIADDTERAKRLFASAAAWHERRGEPTMALYYRLQGWRWRKRPPRPGEVPPALALRFTDDLIRELPRPAQDVLAVARGERSTRLRGAPQRVGEVRRARPKRRFDAAVADEVRMLLHRRQHAEAACMVSQATDFSAIDPASPQAAAVIEALWRAGIWDHARALLARRREALENVTLQARDVAALCEVFAELDPPGFRALVRAGHGFPELLMELDESRAGDIEWAIAPLLLKAEGFATVSGFAREVWAAATSEWAGDERKLLPDPVHARMLDCRLQALAKEQAAQVPVLVSAILAAQAGTGSAGADVPAVARYAVDHADARGGLASLAAALALLHPDAALGEVAEAARRRAASCAGYWSYGEVPAGWIQPATDRRTATALRGFVGPEPVTQAREAIDHWRAGYGSAGDAFATLIGRCEEIARAVAPVPPDLQAVAQRLIEAGIPLVLAPPFAVLATSGDTTSPLSAEEH